MAQDKKKVTIYDVAAAAGCSTATVSLALKNDVRIKARTRERIAQIAREMEYQPSYFARALSLQSSFTIGVLLPNMENPLFSKILSGVYSYAEEQGFSLIISGSDQSWEKERRHLDMLTQKQVDGIIVFPSFYDSVIEYITKTPPSERASFVLAGIDCQDPSISYVACDRHKGAFMAVEHLIQTGRRHIAFISTSTHAKTHARFQGYKDALVTNGIPFNDDLVCYCQSNHESVYEATIRLLETQKVDGIFCMYDYLALPVSSAIFKKGYRLPEDIAIVGYDNIEISAYFPIPLSTIETHALEIGRQAAKTLIGKIRNPQTDPQQIILQPELIVRHST